MIDFVEYVVSELKSRRLSKASALELIRQFSGNTGGAARETVIHPLVQRNVSDLQEQRYGTLFSGKEFYLIDHRVMMDGKPQSVLPGVAYLEMARAALMDALPDGNESAPVELTDVVWLAPLVVSATRQVFIALAPAATDAGGIEFEIFSAGPDETGDDVVHCRGMVRMLAEDASAPLDIASIERRMTRGRIDAAEVYAAYREMGIRFGPAHQSVRTVIAGRDEALARLILPETVDGTLSAYRLHPSLVDGALQASIGLLPDLDNLPRDSSLPFALETMRVFAPCPKEMMVWVRHAADSQPQRGVIRLDIDLCDAEGSVCAQLRGFTSRALGAGPAPVGAGNDNKAGLVLASVAWQDAPLSARVNEYATFIHHVIVCNWPDEEVSDLQNLAPRLQWHRLKGSPESAVGFTALALDAFEIIRNILRNPDGIPARVQLLLRAGEQDALLALSGLFKTAALENPDFQGQVVIQDGAMTAQHLWGCLQAEIEQTSAPVVRYRGATRQVPGWIDHSELDIAPRMLIKEHGVYVLTGGLGGLGKLFAADILRHTRSAKVVLTGRADSDSVLPRVQALAAELGAGERLVYRQIDLADLNDVRGLMAELTASLGPIKGIIHSAGMIADSFIVKKTAAEFASVLKPKVYGAANLDLASQDIDLDFLVLFSSGASVMGNLGQADYAVANGYLDHYAARRNQMVAAGLRSGATLAINWPLWRDGGMHMPERQQEAMRAATGMLPLSSVHGLRAFHAGLDAGLGQMLVVEGELDKIRAELFGKASTITIEDADAERGEVRAVDGAHAAQGVDKFIPADLRQRTRDYLRHQLAVLFKLPYGKIDPCAPLEKYGIDSVLAMDLTAQLEKHFGALSKTLFFEYQTIDELADYFMQTHDASLRKLFPVGAAEADSGVGQSAMPVGGTVGSSDVAVASSTARRVQRKKGRATASVQAHTLPDNHQHEPIAIVGLSGRYPQAEDIEAFWTVLRDGKNCITEVPAERWNWRDYYSEDRNAPGRHYSKWGGFIRGIDEFDPLFFNIPPVDAHMLDPQERMFLQHAWMAVEDAGYTRASMQIPSHNGPPGQVGVYVGVMYGEYQLLGAEASVHGQPVGVPVSYASIANRVSYVMNLHGPSMTLDTMCSSSLTAMHLACQDLKQGRTDLAIAGGVNLSMHPNKYLILSAGQYISGDGACQSFGEGGDGYIPGEGVGVVVLKRLADAERDGNHIYGVIKGSALNHGGKTNGYSVPNPKLQAAVIAMAMKEAGIDARHIGYIEAHGTGTKLGDPIEVAALSQAFRRDTDERQFCALGSAKSNVGHCESAAGIAGLTKILLQMRHGMLVPSLHAERLNPHIDFAASPFVVNQILTPWARTRINGREIPRIAGLSSFGAGGSNAHFIIEEYRAAHTPSTEASEPTLIPLSARTDDQLRRKASQLADYIQARPGALDLRAVAHTLQSGREVLDVRLALVVNSLAELADKLHVYARGEDPVAQCFAGRVAPDAGFVDSLDQDEDMAETIDRWIARGKFDRLAELWVNGLTLDWRKFHGDRRPTLVSLPTYPFARDRYWFNGGEAARKAASGQSAHLHPLLHVNLSNFFQQRYQSVFDGREFFLTDHQISLPGVGKQKVLPAVAYLEMVRAAVAHAFGDTEGQLELENVVWVEPLVVDGSATVTIALLADDRGGVGFEVLSGAAEGETHQHCHGHARRVEPEARGPVDLRAVDATLSQTSIPPQALYNVFGALGVHYGPAFQCVEIVRRGNDQVLAELAVRDGAPGWDQGLMLYPGLLDGALQASLGMMGDIASLREPAIPFMLDRFVMVAPCGPRMQAWIRKAADSDAAAGITKLDLDLLDTNGQVCLRLIGLGLRAVRRDPERGLLLARPEWQSVSPQGEPVATVATEHHHVWLCGKQVPGTELVAAAMPGREVRLILAADAKDSHAKRYQRAALAGFEQLQALMQAGVTDRTLVQLVVVGAEDDALLTGLSGLIASARRENPLLLGQLVVCAPDMDAANLAARLHAAAASPHEPCIDIAAAVPSVLRWQQLPVDEATPMAWRDGGVYLITGGMGGLGTLFTRNIFAHSKDAVVVLSGRSALTDEKRDDLVHLAEELQVPLSRLVYRQIDLTRQAEVEAVVAAIAAQFGGLHGVLHSAGMIHDGFIVNKTPQEFARVLAPKVAGTENLDLATQRLRLDFFALFSSMASAVGNVGQADYAAANGFMDHYAGYRNALVATGARHGRTVSLHWPLWQDGGMRLDNATLAALRAVSGMEPLATASGMLAFHQSLSQTSARVLVAEGNVDRLLRVLRPEPTVAPTTDVVGTASTLPTDADDSLHDRTVRYLIGEFSELMRIPAHEVEPKAALEKYGMDSVLAMKLTNQLEQRFGALSKTLFFEYQNLASLAGHLVKAFPDKLSVLIGTAESGQAAASMAAVSSTPAMTVGAARPRKMLAGKLAPSQHPKPIDDIAIIGVAGRYPQAANLREFWDNLKQGRDCITEIPPERWDHSMFFHPERHQPGKAYSKWGGFLDGVDTFDALFFSISPKEAELIDPQERLFLETVWQTMEDAGYDRVAYAGQHVGVYVGVMWGQYEFYGVNAGAGGMPSSSFASVANRVSYFFDFHGPSLAVDTMCSSSLTAIHLACEALRQGSVPLAIAGGVNLSLHPAKYLSLSQGNFASTDGRCRSFGAGGDGYVPGEGVGAVLLKPLHQAVADGDQIYAVIKAAVVNHGGKTNGYTVPNPVAQGELIRNALDLARVNPASIGYVETHGTGTALGDPIEMTGLVRAYTNAGDGSMQAQSCAIGSVKSNIGHLESAAGIAALTKVLLQFKYGQRVPSLHAQALNPHIDFAGTPFQVQRTLEDWPSLDGKPRRAAISSFGAGGSNAHVILEEFQAPPSSQHQRPEAVLMSARDQASLRVYAQNLIAHLLDEPGLALSDVAFTTQVGRTAMTHRLAVIASTTIELIDKLRVWLAQSASGATALEHVFEGRVGKDVPGDVPVVDVVRQNLSGLAESWIHGASIDWPALFRNESVRRVSLPTYPFVREHYWIETGAIPPATPSMAVQAQTPGDTDLLYYEATWQASEAPVASATGASSLLLLNADAVLASALRWAIPDAMIITVEMAGPYRQRDNGHYCVDARSSADVVRLVQDLHAAGTFPDTVVHCAGYGSVDKQLDEGVYAIHALCQAWLASQVRGPLKLLSLHGGTSGVTNDVSLALHLALAGYCRSLALERPGFVWKLLSIDDPWPMDTLVRHIVLELDDASWRDGEVRYRGGSQTLRRELKTMQPRNRAQAPLGAPIRQRGVYLITGGLGGVGYLFGTWLVKEYGARLVLSGRSALADALQRKLALLQAHADQPDDVVYVQADVADASHTQHLVAEAQRRYGRLDGVIHSAGIHRDAFVLNKSREEMAQVLSAKIQGCLNLDEATRHQSLDWFVLFSSVAGAVGNVGQSDYAYANNFLDAFAEQRMRWVEAGERAGHTLSINWPLWEDGGMQLPASDIELLARKTGLRPLPTEVGVASWEELLRGGDVQCMPVYGNAAKITAYLSAPLSVTQMVSATAPVAAPALRPVGVDVSDQAMDTALEGYLRAMLGDEIKLPVERIDPQEPLTSFGVDSMMISRMNTKLERDFGALPKTLFYQYESIEALAGYFLSEAAAAVARRFGDAQSRAITQASVPDSQSTHVDSPVGTKSEPIQAVLTQATVMPDARREPIAIIGVHGRFPGSDSAQAFWQNLRAGKDLIVPVPQERWDAEEHFADDPDLAREGKIYCKWGGFLNDVDTFDASFFSISADDARMMDPQERLFIQSVWSALEDAGYTRDSLKAQHPKGKSADVGVFVGVTTNTYQMLAPEEWRRGNMVAPGSLPWSIANRVSYFFDFQGPSMPIDTACSSSLMALHLAGESLRNGDCQVAIAGGVNLYLHPSKYQSLCRRRMLAVDGKCRSFGHGDDGFIPGEGLGTVILKPLSRAMADGDHVYGVVVASATAHSGRSNGYSAPNPNSQALLIEEALAKAEIDPATISYVEGHGTGTQLGDSLEVLSLTQAFGKRTARKQFCALGSLKANAGHAESAAGIAGVIKVLMQFKYREIAPTLHADPVNPDIPFADTPFYLQRQLTPWKVAAGHVRRAMINSFGAGGVNACVILEEAPAVAPTIGAARQKHLMVLSARDESGLRERAADLLEYLKHNDLVDMSRLAYTMQIGREAMEQRLAVVAENAAGLATELAAYLEQRPSTGLSASRVEPHRRKKSVSTEDRERVRLAVAQSDLAAIAQRWVAGQEISWNLLHEGHSVRRLPLPTYPFSSTRYWLSDGASAAPIKHEVGPRREEVAGPPRLHPLVHDNVSTLNEIGFASSLSAQHYYGRDHRINGEAIFPGSGFVEMACASGAFAAEVPVVRINDVFWLHPLKLDDAGLQVKTLLQASGGDVQYTIVSLDSDHEQIVHAEGRLVFQADDAVGGDSEPAVSLPELRQRATRMLGHEECYRQFRQGGFDYGFSFQTIQELHIGSDFALSKLKLADSLLEDFDQYLLHPCLLDGALQTVIGMVAGHGANTPHVPFAVDAIAILHPLTETCHVYVERSAGDTASGDIMMFDIRLLNANGEVLVKLTNFYVRALTKGADGEIDEAELSVVD